MELLDKFFKIRERNSSVGREALAGLVTFFAMSYILAVNPAILAQAGMDKAELVTVTAVAAAIGCALMAFMANLPVALAPTMGTNTYFAIIVCVGMGLDWREALALTFYNGIFFFIISVTGIREKLIAGVPRPMQAALQCGIGMFIAFFGLQSAKLVVSNPATLVTGGRLGSPECLFALAGVALIAVLVARKVRSAIIISIAAMTAAAFFIDDSSGARMAKIPNAVFSIPHGISETFMQLDFAYPFRDFHKAARVIFVLLMLDLLDTIATVVAMASRCGIMRPDGTFPKRGRALTADASATRLGALLGTSTTGRAHGAHSPLYGRVFHRRPISFAADKRRPRGGDRPRADSNRDFDVRKHIADKIFGSRGADTRVFLHNDGGAMLQDFGRVRLRNGRVRPAYVRHGARSGNSARNVAAFFDNVRIFVRGVDNKSLGGAPRKTKYIPARNSARGNLRGSAQLRKAISGGNFRKNAPAQIRKLGGSAPAESRAPKPAEYPQEPRNPLPTPRRSKDF